MRYVRALGTIGCLVMLSGCHTDPCGSPSAPGCPSTPITTTTASSTTTTVLTESSGHYLGTITQPGQGPLPIDLSLYFGLPRASVLSAGFRPTAVYDVLSKSGYNTGPAG